MDMSELATEIYCGISNWNDASDDGNGERYLTEQQVGELSDALYAKAIEVLL